MLDELNQLRSTRHLSPLDRTQLPVLREDACHQEISLHSLSTTVSSAGWVTMFTSADASALPKEIQKIAANGDAHSVALGACYPQGDRGGFTQFRVIAIFFRTAN